MRKAILLLSLSTIISVSAKSQDTNGETEPKPKAWQGFTINPFIGIGAASTTYRIPSLESYTPGGGGSAILGAQVGYNLNSHVSFNAGLAFSAYIWQIPFPGTMVKHAQSSSSFLTIPIAVKIVTSKYNKVGFLVEPSLGLNFLSAVEERVEYVSGSPDVSTSDMFHNKFLPTFNLILGLRIPVSKSTWIDAGIESCYFLKDQYVDEPGKTVSGGIRIGVQTKLTK